MYVVYDGIHMNKIQQIQVVNTNVSICEENGHDFETVRIIDTEIVDGTKYEVVLIECLECGEEETGLGDEIEIEWEEVV
jgi:hypothetical protein